MREGGAKKQTSPLPLVCLHGTRLLSNWAECHSLAPVGALCKEWHPPSTTPQEVREGNTVWWVSCDLAPCQGGLPSSQLSLLACTSLADSPPEILLSTTEFPLGSLQVVSSSSGLQVFPSVLLYLNPLFLTSSSRKPSELTKWVDPFLSNVQFTSNFNVCMRVPHFHTASVFYHE